MITVEADINEALAAYGVTVEGTATGQVSAASSGYVLAIESTPWRYSFDASESLLGIYRLLFWDVDGVPVDVRYVWISASSGTFVASCTFDECLLRQSLAAMSEVIAAVNSQVNVTVSRIGMPADTLANDLAAAKAELDKVPRADLPLGSGEVHRRTNQHNEYVDELITKKAS